MSTTKVTQSCQFTVEPEVEVEVEFGEPEVEVEEPEVEVEGIITKFEQALINGECDVVDAMLEQGYIPDPDSIKIVCGQGNIDLLHKLLRFPMNIQGGMRVAVYGNYIDVLNHLYLAGGDVNLPDEDENGNTLLHLVNDVETCQWLLDMGAKQVPNDDGETPLHWACEMLDVKLIKLLLSREDGIQSLNQLDNHDSSPLHWACYNSASVVERLLSYDQAVQTLTQVNVQGYTPLNLACHNQKTVIVDLILSNDQGIQSISIPNNKGDTPLHEACINNDCETAELLLKFEQGVKLINQPNNKGKTPSHIACLKDDDDLSELLDQYE